jgi:ATP-dependent Lhr-like helicase
MRALLGSGRTAGSTAHRAKRAVPRGRYGSLTAAARTASRTGPPTVGGRWSLLPGRDTDATVRAHALARTLLDRHGVVTRGAVSAEGVEGGFSAVYRVLSVFEDSGQARRGYVVEGLGAAQFAMDGAVDRLRAVANARERGEGLSGTAPGDGGGPDGFGSPGASPLPAGLEPPAGLDRIDGSAPSDDFVAGGGFAPSDGFGDGPGGDTDPFGTDGPAWGCRVPSRDLAAPGYGGPRGGGPAAPHRFGPGDRRGRGGGADSRAVVLAAADPANAYGAALPWPEPPTGAGHKPGRKAGSLVVLVDGELTLYMERGGKTLLAWPADPDGPAVDDPRLRAAADALATAARAGSLGTVTVERVNGASALTSPIGALLEGAGFIATPRGLRLRA